MRRLLLAFVWGLLLLPGIAFSQEPGYAYEKPELEIYISGGDKLFQSQLQDKLTASLSDKYTIRFVTTPPSTRGVIITRLSTGKIAAEITGSSRSSRFLERTVTGNTYDEIAGKVSDAAMLNFPLEANIRSREKDLVYLDRSVLTGFALGVYCDVYDENEHIGVIKIVQANENQSIAKIVRGKNRIDMGNSVRTRHFLKRYGVALESFYVPASSGMGEVYKRLTGDSASGVELKSAYTVTASLVADLFPGGSQLGLGGGVMSLGDFSFLLLQAYYSPAVTIIYDRLSLSSLIGGGVFFVTSQPYAMPNDSSTYWQGDTDSNAQWYFRVEPGIRFYLTRGVSISLFGGYFYSGKGDDWSNSVGEGDNRKVEKRESTWVRYDHIQVSGFSYGIALSFSGIVAKWF
jgi:hypothetical protein